MAVRRLGSNAAPKQKRTTTKTATKPRTEQASLALPTQKKSPRADFFSYIHCYYGRAGIGKTTLAAAFPDTLMFSCERVSGGIECYDLNADNGGVHNWEIFQQGVDLLEGSDRFATVAIDTVEAAYNQCQDWVCATKGLKHPSEANDYGKTWAAVMEEFHRQMARIYNSGRGLVLLSHAKEVEITAHSGEKYTRIQPSLGGKAFEWLKQKTDFVIYCEYVKDVSGSSRRVFITAGDEIVDAKHPGEMPTYLPFLKGEAGVDMLVQGFQGDDVGIPVEELRPSTNTSKAATQLVRSQSARAAMNKQKGGPKRKKK